jgi:hypothetical protein
MPHRLEIVGEIRSNLIRFGTTGTQFTVRFIPPTDHDLNLVDHFLTSVNYLFEHVLQGVQDSDMVVVAIRN